MSAGSGSAAELQPGQVFEGKYKILRELGRGGFGMVYLAFQEGMDRHVALKILKSSVTAQAPSAKDRFLREVKIISRLKHPNTVTIHDFGETWDGGLYMVLEYVEGETLKQVLKREGAQDPLRGAEIARQIARSLSEAHQHGVVHRDLKPANIMLTSIETGKDFVKVLDFGVARLLDAPTDDLTSVGLPEGERELIGTPRYMSPEQVRGENLTGASDIYGLGLMLYELLAGEPAVQGDTTMGLITQQISPEPLRLPHLNAFPPPLQDIVRISTTKQLNDRFQTADQMADALEETIFMIRRERNLTGPSNPSGFQLSSYQSQLSAQQPEWLERGSSFQSGPADSWNSGGHQSIPPQSGGHAGMNSFQSSGPFASGVVPSPPAPPPRSLSPGFNELELPQDDDYQPTVERDALSRASLPPTGVGAAGLSLEELPPVPLDDRPFDPESEAEDDPHAPPPAEPDLSPPAISASISRIKTRPQPEESLSEFAIGLLQVLALSTLAIFVSYVMFLVLGAWIDSFAHGAVKLIGAALGALVVPVGLIVIESLNSDRFRVVAKFSDRATGVLVKSTVIGVFVVVVLSAVFAGKIVPNLQVDPNWFFAEEDAPGLPRLNRTVSYGVADAIATTMGAIGLYDPKSAAMRKRAAQTGTAPRKLAPGRTRALPPSTRDGNKQQRTRPAAPTGGSDTKKSEYEKW